MTRVRISSLMTAPFQILTCGGSIFLYVFAIITFAHNGSITAREVMVLAFGLVALVVLSVYVLHLRTTMVDTEGIYFRSIWKSERISFGSVERVDFSPFILGWKWDSLYIRYHDSIGRLKSIRVLPKWDPFRWMSSGRTVNEAAELLLSRLPRGVISRTSRGGYNWHKMAQDVSDVG